MVEFDIRGHCAVVTINRPEARNAINAAVSRGIEEAIDRIESTESLWAGVLTGAPPVFCAGGDLEEVRAGNSAGLRTERGGFGGITRRRRTKPIIAAVDGPALAGGAEIVLACDLVVATERAAFGLPEVQRSLVASAGGLFRLGRKIPINVAMECALTGRPIAAARAHQLGLVNVLCAEGQVVQAALDLADRILANAPLAVRAARRIVAEGTNAPDEVAWRLSQEGFDEMQDTDDFREGVGAFLEKRPPQWHAR